MIWRRKCPKGKAALYHKHFVLLLATIAFVGQAAGQESETSLRVEMRPSFEAMKERARGIIAKQKEDVRRIEFVIAESEARIRKSIKADSEYGQTLEKQAETLQFLETRISHSPDNKIIVIGYRRYPREMVAANMAVRSQAIAETAQERLEMKANMEKRQEYIQKQKASLERVRSQLSRAETVLNEQQSRWERTSLEMAVSDIVQRVCPQGDLLLASDTQLGNILSEIEILVGTFEALQEMKNELMDIDLLDIQKMPRTGHQRKE